jgi:hypothetical protein
MKLRMILFGVSIFGILGFGLMLSAQSTAPAPATKPATTPAATAPTTATASAPSTTASAPASGPSAQTKSCLRCHPFEKVREATKNWIAPSKEKITPHYYVPHDSKTDKDVPECLKCHKTHALDPLPEKGQIDLSKLNVNWCYDACHHEKNFDKCNKCH